MAALRVALFVSAVLALIGPVIGTLVRRGPS